MIQTPIIFGFPSPPDSRLIPDFGLLATLLRVGLPPRGAGV